MKMKVKSITLGQPVVVCVCVCMYICQIIGSGRAKVREGRGRIPWGSEGIQYSLNQDDSLADE